MIKDYDFATARDLFEQSAQTNRVSLAEMLYERVDSLGDFVVVHSTNLLLVIPVLVSHLRSRDRSVWHGESGRVDADLFPQF